MRAIGMGWPDLPECDDASVQALARRAVEGVALAAGIPVPTVRVVAHARPTVFTVTGRLGPTVVFTTALVALLSSQELEAAAAHEVGHIVSDSIEDSQTTEALLDLLRLLGAAVLILALIATRATVGWPWAVLVAALVASGLIDEASYEWERRPGRFVEATVVLVNPMMVLANLLAQAFYSALGQDEDLLADLRAVELTQNPGALHSALRRLRDATIVGPPLTVAYHARYFTAEGTLPEGFPSAQASIDARLATLERIEPDLRASIPVHPRAVQCPDCGRPLESRRLESHYGAPIVVDRCAACGGIWFDDLELYVAGARDLIEAAAGDPTPRPHEGPIDCPRCGVALQRLPPLGMPADVSIWECPACRGAWVRPPDLAGFGAFRQRREALRACKDSGTV
jgi:Zn-dependent protease with chaperone function/Zn-finger nucleic acid-binding protein